MTWHWGRITKKYDWTWTLTWNIHNNMCRWWSTSLWLSFSSRMTTSFNKKQLFFHLQKMRLIVSLSSLLCILLSSLSPKVKRHINCQIIVTLKKSKEIKLDTFYHLSLIFPPHVWRINYELTSIIKQSRWTIPSCIVVCSIIVYL